MIILTHIPRHNYRQIHWECNMHTLYEYIIRHYITLQNVWKWPTILQMRTVQQTKERRKVNKEAKKILTKCLWLLIVPMTVSFAINALINVTKYEMMNVRHFQNRRQTRLMTRHSTSLPRSRNQTQRQVHHPWNSAFPVQTEDILIALYARNRGLNLWQRQLKLVLQPFSTMKYMYLLVRYAVLVTLSTEYWLLMRCRK